MRRRNPLQPVWKTRYRILALDADLISLAKVSALCNYFQESAWQHANHLGVGYTALFRQGLVWVLSRFRIQIDAYPTWGDEVEMQTWPVTVSGLHALRDFTILRSNGQKIISGSSAWLVLDKESKKPYRNLVCLLQNVPEYPLPPVFNEEIQKIRNVPEPELAATVTAAYSDLDANGHVNNNRYIEWACDAFEANWYKRLRIHDMSVNFLSETHAGESLQILKKSSSPYIWEVEGRKNDINSTPVFRSRLIFAEHI